MNQTPVSFSAKRLEEDELIVQMQRDQQWKSKASFTACLWFLAQVVSSLSFSKIIECQRRVNPGIDVNEAEAQVRKMNFPNSLGDNLKSKR